jgi:signal transduction histidine kinase
MRHPLGYVRQALHAHVDPDAGASPALRPYAPAYLAHLAATYASDQQWGDGPVPDDLALHHQVAATLAAPAACGPQGVRLEELAKVALGGVIARGEIALRDLRPGHSDETRHVQVIAAPDGDDGVWILLRDLTEIMRLRQIRSEFVDNLSHELRTPLSTIRLLAESVATAGERGDASGARERASQIEVEVLHLVQMADEMLDLATLEAGEIPLRSAPVNLLDLANEVATRFAPVATRHGGAIRVESEGPGPWIVLGDRDRLRQALANLVHNGVKYSRPEGVVTIHLSMPAVGAGNASIEIKIADQGIGIERRHLPRIFERFYTVERIAGEQASVGGAGTGLGLAIARHAVLRHGGSIEVDSAIGVGTTFTILLPKGGAAASLPPR